MISSGLHRRPWSCPPPDGARYHGDLPFQKDGAWGFSCTDETAAKYNASSPEDTQDSDVADARFPDPRATRYPGGLLPD